MNVWESGRESHLLDDIIAGRKTIEGRLNRGKFAQYKVGDQIKLRRDIRDNSGKLRDGIFDGTRVKITAITQYNSFKEMMKHEEFTSLIPNAKTPEEASNEYTKYYSSADQKKYGVLAIGIKYINL